MFYCSAFDKHNRNHACNPTRQFPVKTERIEKSMPNYSTQKGCNTHYKKVNFEVEKRFFLFARPMNFPCVNKTQHRYKQIGYCYYRFIDLNSKQINRIYFIHVFLFWGFSAKLMCFLMSLKIGNIMHISKYLT